MDISNRLKNAVAAFRKTKTNNAEGFDPNAYLKYGKRNMPSTWSTPQISDEDFYTGYGFAVVNKRANRSVVLGKKYLFTNAKDEIIKQANEQGVSITHPYLDLIRDSIDFAERDFWYDISTYLDLEGIYYLMAVRTVTGSGAVGNIQKFSLLNPYWVKPVVNNKGQLGGYVENNPTKGKRIIPKEMIIPIKLLNPFDPSKPYSLADAARDAQFTMKQANDFSRASIDGNLNAPGILSSAIELPDDQFDNFVARVKGHNRGEPLFGNGAGTISWTDMQTDLDKAALDKINSINRDALLAVSGLSKTGVGVEESGTGREVSRTQKDDFTENAVMPQIENIIDALNLDYRRFYERDYQKNKYVISLDNPLETDRDAEAKDVEIRQSQFDLQQSLIAKGYDVELAGKYAKGLITVTDLGEPSNPPTPEPTPPSGDATPSGDGTDQNAPADPPAEPKKKKKASVYEGYPVPLNQYLGDLAEQITSLSEKNSILYLTEDQDKVRITEIIDRDGDLVGVIDENSYVKLGEFKEEADKEVILSELNKRYHDQLVAVKHKGVKHKLNKDFYNKLPSVVQVVLDNIASKYQDREWLGDAWSDYRDHVINTPEKDIKLPGVSFKKYVKMSSEKVSTFIAEEETHQHSAPFDQQDQVNASSEALLGSVKSAENAMLNYYTDQITQGYLSPHADPEPFINGLTLPFATWFTVMFPIFASRRAKDTAKELGVKDIPVTAITDDVKQTISEFARKEATSHMNTIRGDIENALAIIRTQTSDPTEVKQMLEAAFIDIQRRRAAAVANNAAGRIFALSQYEADLQLLTRHNLVKRAFKQLYSSTGDPCQFCAFLIATTQKAPIPFTQNFADLGDDITVDGKTLPINYEPVVAGNVHPNCRCYYKILIIEPEVDNSAEVEKEDAEKQAQTISEIVEKQLAPILEKLDEDKGVSNETMNKLSEMSNRLDEQIDRYEQKLEELDKRTKEARQLKEELLEANELKSKLSEAEEYARQLESILDGQS